MNKHIESITQAVQAKFSVVAVTPVRDDQAALDVKPGELHAVLSFVKAQGFRQLSMLTCVDWIQDGEFQLVYLLFDWDKGVRLQVRTRIDRKHPTFTTVTNIYPGVQYYERDVHEFFGVEFEGNEMSFKQLFLENWDDIPPMRKDFNSKAYSDKKFPVREYHKDFSKEGDGK
ncbi:MAG TPA: NADH-quinone oxidoreductase subunit C [Candidatus Limiplasma sp.]|nr:NADH-quinone oxidoreductase subunit C [Candidatus Limiplasma sp.]HRX09178.1 NADH-quinone oxidoreductase subunit C [Candidatus Limiplasma sp.]